MPLSRWRIENELTKGTHSFLHIVRDITGETDFPCILKRADYPENAGPLVKEIEALRSIHHPHIVPVVDASILPDDCYLVTPQASLGDCAVQPDIDNPLPFLLELAQTVLFLHERKIAHRDISPANIFLHPQGFWLGDFGTCQSPVGEEDGHLFLRDIFDFAKLAFFLTSRGTFFDESQPAAAQIEQLCLDQKLTNLLENMLQPPSRRLSSMDDIMQRLKMAL